MIASKGAHLVSITRVRKTFAPDLLAELREALLFVLADHVECALIEIEHLPRLDSELAELRVPRRGSSRSRTHASVGCTRVGGGSGR